MAKKLNYYRGYGKELISLFARLLFSGESYSLTELSRMLDCSKQTVMEFPEFPGHHTKLFGNFMGSRGVRQIYGYDFHAIQGRLIRRRRQPHPAGQGFQKMCIFPGKQA